MMKDKNRKLVLIMHSMLTERWIDIFCIEELNEQFDFEFWDCTAIVAGALTFSSYIDKPYLRIIKSNSDFEQRLKELPSDTIISTLVMFFPENYHFHKILSTYFKNINFVNFYSNDGPNTLHESDTLQQGKVDLRGGIKRIKRYLYKSDVIRYIAKVILQPNKEKRQQNKQGLISQKEMGMYHQIIGICSNLNTKYQINHPDVEKYVQIREERTYTDRFVVFLDEYYPNHPDTFEQLRNIDVNQLRTMYYQSVNAFFEKIEKEYGCKVIIAAHPHSNYQDNPFGGREIIKYHTAELVRDSIAVCMHAGCTLSYVALFDKPVLAMHNKATKQNAHFQQYIETETTAWHMQLVDIDEADVEVRFEKIPSYYREKYIELNFGVVDDNLRSNKELLPMHMNAIYDELYGGE